MFYTREELAKMGFASLGKNVCISKKTVIDCPDKISICNNVKIGSHVILSGEIYIGNHVHIASFTSLYGGGGITIGDYVGISNYVRILTESDDYSGKSMIGAFIPERYTHTIRKKVDIEKHVVVGSGSLILPGAFLAEGVAIGAMSMVCRKTRPWGIYFGNPAKRIMERSKELIDLERQFEREKNKE